MVSVTLQTATNHVDLRVSPRPLLRECRLGKTTESEQLFANELGVYTTRTVKRVPDTEQKRADLVKGLQGTPWNRLAGRPAGRPRKTDPQATPVATSPVAKRKPNVRVKMRTSAAVRSRKTSILQSLMSSEFLVQQTPRTNRAHRRPDPQRPKMGALEATQPATTEHRSDRQLQLRADRWNKQIRVTDTT